ncbi:chloride channel protein [Oscillatoria acuminata]|uniref:Chloride channel protein EriC n=1 Tax=Oscillatoria acuminata PCC 6304 TaxID=56110 RepID=K9TM63_9CYAN|nr:chloride channel protein [Oscillatoria acuminata]AFY83937.1 chloride channel protein EriC [Oscillatoria acuminata PCC 6304]
MTALPPPDRLRPGQAPPAPSKSALTSFLNRLQPTPETVVLLLAVFIGSSTGMGIVTFHYLIHLIHTVMLEDVMGVISPAGPWTLACIPALGGAVVGLMRWHRPDFGPGISALIAATQGLRELLPLRPVTKMVAASVSLGTGASLGPEGPSVEIGANFGMLLGEVLQVSRERQRLLLGAGAAAGLAAGFNAPIAGVFFALEVVLGTTFATSAVSVVLLAAVVAALIAQIGLGSQPAFTLPMYDVRSPLELPLYLGLGLLAAGVSIAFTETIQFARRCFRGEVALVRCLGRIPRPIHPAIGGVVVGLVALQWPQIMGIGYETVEAMLQDVEFSLPLLVTLLVVKLGITAFCQGSGLVGGVFAPAMFLGASLGSAYGKVLAANLPAVASHIAAPPAYAMVGMAAVLAGTAKAPLTAILLLFELTRDYRIVLPLMAAVGLAAWLVEGSKVRNDSELNPEQMGFNVAPDRPVEILEQMSVAAAMHESFLILKDTQSVLEAGLALTQGRSYSALVFDSTDRLMGIISLQDIERAIALGERPGSTRVESDSEAVPWIKQAIAEICTLEVLYAYPDELLSEALDRMAARGLRQLPVVDPDDPHRVLGLLDREGIALACNVAAVSEALAPYVLLPNAAPSLELSEGDRAA